jgi:Uncharacterized protein conserved in bacteria (DUF2330)
MLETKRGFRWMLATASIGVVVLAFATPAGACGGLVGANGTIKLTRTTTLAAYHDGIERYVTSFEFSGQGKEVGSIVPLPGVPSNVKRAGDWTLQRLEREVAPPVRESFDSDAKAASASPAQVLLQTRVDALDITILKGGGDAVGTWATDHGFLLTPDAPAMLTFYARRSPIFMAARFDAERARKLRQVSGDGTPIMLTIPTRTPWVPLHILSLGLKQSEVVQADVFLLTDTRPEMLAGGRGLKLDRDESADASLLSDLRTDKGMGWVPQHMWFTFLRLDAPAKDLDYDLAVSVKPGTVPKLADTGVTAEQVHYVKAAHGRALWPLALGAIVGVGIFGLASLFGRRRRTTLGVS